MPPCYGRDLPWEERRAAVPIQSATKPGGGWPVTVLRLKLPPMLHLHQCGYFAPDLRSPHGPMPKSSVKNNLSRQEADNVQQHIGSSNQVRGVGELCRIVADAYPYGGDRLTVASEVR